MPVRRIKKSDQSVQGATSECVGELSIVENDGAARGSNRIATKNSFVDYAWKSFDLEQVCCILCHEKTSFIGHKFVLIAALCGWILESGKKPSEKDANKQSEKARGLIRKRSITLAIAELMWKAERRSVRNARYSKFTSNPYAGIPGLPQAFFDELYFPIGGLRTIMRCPTRAWLRKKADGARKRIYLSITLAAIEHCHFQSRAGGRHLIETSLEKSATLVGIMLAASRGEEAPIENNVDNNHYKHVSSSLPFLYSAQSIDLNDGRSLLDAIMEGDWKSINAPDIKRCWLERTLYWTKDVLAPHRRSSDDELIIKSLSSITPEPFEPPDYVRGHSHIIEYFHSKRNILAEYNNREEDFWAAVNMQRPRITGKALEWPTPIVKGSDREQTRFKPS